MLNKQKADYQIRMQNIAELHVLQATANYYALRTCNDMDLVESDRDVAKIFGSKFQTNSQYIAGWYLSQLIISSDKKFEKLSDYFLNKFNCLQNC